MRALRPVVWALSPAEQARHPHVAAFDRARARVVVVPALTPGVWAMTLGRVVFVRRGHERERGLLAHELVHVQQWRERGAVRFLARYLGDYVRGRLRGLGHLGAYAAIRAESEARARSGW